MKATENNAEIYASSTNLWQAKRLGITAGMEDYKLIKGIFDNARVN
jgi:hypothetical protein